MSTRRPNMPRANRPAGGGPSQGSGQGDAKDTDRREPDAGKVIRADFGRAAPDAPARPEAGSGSSSPGTAGAAHRRKPKPPAKPKPAPSEARAAERRQLSEGI